MTAFFLARRAPRTPAPYPTGELLPATMPWGDNTIHPKLGWRVRSHTDIYTSGWDTRQAGLFQRMYSLHVFNPGYEARAHNNNYGYAGVVLRTVHKTRFGTLHARTNANNATYSYWGSNSASASAIVTTGDFTLLLLARLDPASPDTADAWNQNNGSAGYFYRFQRVSGTNRIRCNTDQNSTTFIESSSDIFDNEFHVIALTRSGSSYTLYVDGKSDATATSSAYNFDGWSFSPYVMYGGITVNTSAIGDFVVSARWARALSEIEHYRVARDPMGMLLGEKPMSPLVLDHIASGAPTLSAATVTNLAATTARPRVTLTF